MPRSASVTEVRAVHRSNRAPTHRGRVARSRRRPRFTTSAAQGETGRACPGHAGPTHGAVSSVVIPAERRESRDPYTRVSPLSDAGGYGSRVSPLARLARDDSGVNVLQARGRGAMLKRAGNSAVIPARSLICG